MNIIDFHTHPFINEKNNSCFYDNIINSNNFKDTLIDAGISHICGSVIYKTNNFDKIKELNREALKLREIWGNFYTPGIHIHPDYVSESIKELNFMAEKGVKLVGELVPYYNGWHNYYDQNMHTIYEEIDRFNMVVSLHTDENVNMDNLERAVSNFKNINFVAAHPQQKDNFYKHIELLNKYNNYYLDLSGKGLNRYGMVKTLVNKCGSEKILFATDYPICNPKMYAEAVLFENLNTNDLENIMYNNSKRLLSI